MTCSYPLSVYETETPANEIGSQVRRKRRVATVTRPARIASIRMICEQDNLNFSTISPPIIVPPAPAGSKTIPGETKVLS